MKSKYYDDDSDCGFTVSHNAIGFSRPVFQTFGTNVELTCRKRLITLRKYPTGIALISTECEVPLSEGLCLMCSLGYGLPSIRYGGG